MQVRFACPSCAAAGAVDAMHIGKQVRCKHCGAHFAIPSPEAAESDVYALEEPVEHLGPSIAASSVQDAVFVPARRDRAVSAARSRPPTQTVSITKRASDRQSGSGFPWETWLIRAGAALILVLTSLALFAPHGTQLAGSILIGLGCLLVPVAYFAGAYGAFSEDTLYGLLYVFFPLYIGYYMVTRWEDLWPWLLCATVGVGFVLIGTELVRWSGAV